MPRAQQWQTYYDVLDGVRRTPAIFLGGVDEKWIAGTRMARLQAFLCGLRFAKLNEGNAPFSDFGAWFSVRFDGIPNSHNMPFHWIEEHEQGKDSAFDLFFKYLDEYRACRVVALEHCNGPFHPNFTVGLDQPRASEHPAAIVLSRFEPSKVFFWAAVYADGARTHFPFFASAASARRDASVRWGIAGGTWSRVARDDQ